MLMSKNLLYLASEGMYFGGYQCSFSLVSKSNAVVPLPDFFESADFLKPISRKSGSVNTKTGKSVTPNFGTIKIGRV